MAANQAQDILDNATMDANEIRMGAIQYTDEKLAELQDIVQRLVDTSHVRYEAMLNNFQDFFNEISSNRAELLPQQPEPEKEEPKEEPETAAPQAME